VRQRRSGVGVRLFWADLGGVGLCRAGLAAAVSLEVCTLLMPRCACTNAQLCSAGGGFERAARALPRLLHGHLLHGHSSLWRTTHKSSDDTCRALSELETRVQEATDYSEEWLPWRWFHGNGDKRSHRATSQMTRSSQINSRMLD